MAASCEPLSYLQGLIKIHMPRTWAEPAESESQEELVAAFKEALRKLLTLPQVEESPLSCSIDFHKGTLAHLGKCGEFPQATQAWIAWRNHFLDPQISFLTLPKNYLSKRWFSLSLLSVPPMCPWPSFFLCIKRMAKKEWCSFIIGWYTHPNPINFN
jgi:hypothetical protein